jgi:hypothetical protein
VDAEDDEDVVDEEVVAGPEVVDEEVIVELEVVDDSASPPQPPASRASDTAKTRATVIAGKIARLAMSTSAPAYPISAIGMHKEQTLLQNKLYALSIAQGNGDGASVGDSASAMLSLAHHRPLLWS